MVLLGFAPFFVTRVAAVVVVRVPVMDVVVVTVEVVVVLRGDVTARRAGLADA